MLGATYGGTGQSSIITGDLLYGSASNTISKLAIGSTGTILRVVAGVPSWGTDYTGTVTSVAATVPSFLSISGSPITTSGTLAITYSGTALPVANGGTNATSAGITAFNNITGYSATGASGTTSTKLVFSDTPVFSGVTYMGSATGQNSVFNAVVGNTGANSGLVIVSSSTGTGWLGFNNANNASIPGQFTYNFNTGTMNLFSSGVITFNTNASGTVAAEIFASGGVSIGNTTDPGAGNLSVTGNVIAPNLQGPAFSAYASTGTSMTTAVATKIIYDSEEFDTNNNFASSRFTPTVGGYYQINAVVTGGNSALGQLTVFIYKNGSQYKAGNQILNNTSYSCAVISCLVYLDGSTDYVEIYASQTSGSTLISYTGSIYTSFNGSFIRST